MGCEACGSSRWGPHGHYETVTGERIRRFRCRECGKTWTRQTALRSRILQFFLFVSRAYVLLGLPRALDVAREWVGVSRATVSRWVRDTDLEEAGAELMADHRAPGGAHQLPLKLGATRRGEEQPAQKTPRARWRVLAECLRLYRSSPSVPQGDVRHWGPPQLPITSDSFLRLLVRARALAAICRGEPFPSWLDRLAHLGEPARQFAFPSEWMVVLHEVDRPGELLDGWSGDGSSPHPELAWSRRRAAGALRAWLRERVLSRDYHVGPPTACRHDVAVHRTVWTVRSALESHLGQSVGIHLQESLDQKVKSWRRRVEPKRLRHLDGELEGLLRYWVRFDGEEIAIAVATRRRVVGRASAPLTDENRNPRGYGEPFGPLWFHPIPIAEPVEHWGVVLAWAGKRHSLGLRVPGDATLVRGEQPAATSKEAEAVPRS